MATASPSSTLPLTDKLDALTITSTEIPPAEPTSFGVLIETLKPKLSSNGSVVVKGSEEYKTITTRWSEHNAPVPGVVVSVGCEEDISAVVRFATANKIPILAQSGGHGFSSSLAALPSNSIVINLRPMNNVSIDLAAGTAKLGAGVLTGEALVAAEKAHAHVMTGICNTVGLVAALLGGGMGNQISLYGLGVDSMLSARLVTASGDVVTASATENEELWWGLRGAGTNFGIVSELTVKAYPEVNKGVHWTGTLGWPGSKENCAKVMESIRSMGVGKGAGVTVLFARVPEMGPTIFTNLWFAGPAEKAREVYQPLFDLSPALEICAETPYSKTNDANDAPCAKGGRKPVFCLGMKKDEWYKLADAYVEWESFSGHEDGDRAQSFVLVECYGYDIVRQVAEGETAYPWRECDAHVVDGPNYSNTALDEEVRAHGERFRALLSSEKPEERKVYVNFGNGDEELKCLFGGEARLERLGGLKSKWDPEGVFSFYHGIS